MACTDFDHYPGNTVVFAGLPPTAGLLVISALDADDPIPSSGPDHGRCDRSRTPSTFALGPICPPVGENHPQPSPLEVAVERLKITKRTQIKIDIKTYRCVRYECFSVFENVKTNPISPVFTPSGWPSGAGRAPPHTPAERTSVAYWIAMPSYAPSRWAQLDIVIVTGHATTFFGFPLGAGPLKKWTHFHTVKTQGR